MNTLLTYPLLLFALSLLVMWLATWGGAWLRKRHPMSEDERTDFGVILTAGLTLVGLIIGFTFSMAIGRYDQRKNYEEEEANAIGTEYVRADLLPAADAAKVRELLRSYLDQRLLFYNARNAGSLREIDEATSQLQSKLWNATVPSASGQSTPTTALAVSGMNDVLNTQGYTLAAWRNRIPVAAWILMEAISLICSGMIGYGTRGKLSSAQFFVLPLLTSISFFLIADIDSPRGGVIRVSPQNLVTLSESMPAH
jgi:hypothetical protein